MTEFRVFVHDLLYETDRLLLQKLFFTRMISESLFNIDLTQVKNNVVDCRTE